MKNFFKTFLDNCEQTFVSELDLNIGLNNNSKMHSKCRKILINYIFHLKKFFFKKKKKKK